MRAKILSWLVIIAIAGAIAGLLLPPVGSQPSGPRLRTIVGLSGWRKALDNYKRDCGSYPDLSEGLNALLFNPGTSNWKGPYIKGMDIEQDPKDGWKTPLRYKLTDAGPDIISAGSDRRFGTADDLDVEAGNAWLSNKPAER